jgi:hypothetical protein
MPFYEYVRAQFILGDGVKIVAFLFSLVSKAVNVEVAWHEAQSPLFPETRQ